MTALSANVKRDHRFFNKVVGTVKAAEILYTGALCAYDSAGEVVAMTQTTGLVQPGVNLGEKVDNTDDGETVELTHGVTVKLANGNSMTAAQIGDMMYAQDDNTAHDTATGRSPIGILRQVDSDGVWVELLTSVTAGLAVANNLSDVGSAATARINLADVKLITFDDVDLVASNSKQVRYVHSGPDCLINHIRTVLSGALATDDATLTPTIGATPVTDGVVTIAESGSAEDDVDASTPSAANEITEGDVLTIAVGGGNTATETANITIELVETT